MTPKNLQESTCSTGALFTDTLKKCSMDDNANCNRELQRQNMLLKSSLFNACCINSETRRYGCVPLTQISPTLLWHSLFEVAHEHTRA